jgi:hypothetical protein
VNPPCPWTVLKIRTLDHLTRRARRIHCFGFGGSTRTVKTFATTLTAFGIVFAGVQWWQIGYRLQLFYRDYGGERYSNHVGDDVFPVIQLANVMLLFAGVFSVCTFWREPGAWRWLAASTAAANAIAWLSFIYVHATGVLVGYGEFIRHWKGQ